jgi:hypothetical protein
MLIWKRKKTKNRTPKLFFLKKSNWNINPKRTRKSEEMNVMIPSHEIHEAQYADS